MPIPPPSGPLGLLPPGRHRATLDEIEDVFVANAPFSAERLLIFDAFKVWRTLWLQVVPTSRFLVDGGFVTHKAWAPRDIDVVAIVKQSDVNALPPPDQESLRDLLTGTSVAGTKIRPMGGLVDAFYLFRGDPQSYLYWDGYWSAYSREDKTIDSAVQKGYLEVS